VNGIIAVGDMPREVHNVYLVFLMDYVEGDPKPDNVEVDGAGFFNLKEMDSMNVAELTRELVRIAFGQPSHGLKANPVKMVSLPTYGLYGIQSLV
jgi:hypothetical protein